MALLRARSKAAFTSRRWPGLAIENTRCGAPVTVTASSNVTVNSMTSSGA